MSMPVPPDVPPILLADDDPDDQLLTREALAACRVANPLQVVEDGQQLLDYLRRDGAYAEGESAPRPALILLDLKMPGLGGHDALAQIKNDPSLRRIPIVVLTTSGLEEDIARSYDQGVNSFVRKPVTFEELVAAVRRLNDYWFDLVKLPPS